MAKRHWNLVDFTDAAALVEELAEGDPYIYGDEVSACHYCQAIWQEDGDEADVTEHAPDCLWMRAKALVQ